MNLISSQDNYILWSLKALLGACLLTPLFVFSGLLFPYTAPKALAFRILIEVAVVLYLYLYWKYPDFRPGKNILNLAVLFFLSGWLVSSVFGVDSYRSFWGDLERMLGVWGIVHFVLFFLMLVSVFGERKEWIWLARGVLAVSALVSFLAILQRFFSLGAVLPQAERVYSTIGNAGFLGTYLIFNLFIVSYLFLQSREDSSRNLARTVLASIFVLNLTALLLTGTRGALLGLASGLGIFVLLAGIFYPNKKYRKYFLAFLVVAIFAVLTLFLYADSSFVQKNSVLRRFVSISLTDATIQNRLILWQKSFEAWKEYPVFGWGVENFELAMNGHFDPRLAPYEAWYDRAHNFVFDYLVATGIFGLMAYLGLIGAAIFCLVKIPPSPPFIKGGEAMIFSISMASLLVAYLVQNFFIFDSFVSFLMLFFVLAMISRFVASPDVMIQPGSKRPKRARMSFRLALLVIAACLLIYSLNIKPLFASYRASQFLSSAPQEMALYEKSDLEKIFGNQTFADQEITYQLTLNYLAKIQEFPQLAQGEDFYRLSSERLKEAIKRSPLQSQNYVVLAWLDLYFSGQDEARITEALELGKQIKEMTPLKKDAYLILTAVYSITNEQEEAEKIVKEAEVIDHAMGKEVREYYESLAQ